MKKNSNKIIIEADDEREFVEQEEEKKTLRILSFSLDEENYCIDISDAKEVIKLNRITKVPNTPQFIAGVMNLRGEIISLIDIKHFFGLNGSKRIEDGRIIATDIKGPLIGILIDKINETIEIEESSKIFNQLNLEDDLEYRETELKAIISQFDSANNIFPSQNIPLSSATGRIFDSVSYLLKTSKIKTYRGEPAMRLEGLASKGNPKNCKTNY